MQSEYHKLRDAASAKGSDPDGATIPMPWTVFIEGGRVASERFADDCSSSRPVASQNQGGTVKDSGCGRPSRGRKTILKLGSMADSGSCRHPLATTVNAGLQIPHVFDDTRSSHNANPIGHAFTPVEGLVVAALLESNSEEQSVDTGIEVACAPSCSSVDLGSIGQSVSDDFERQIDSVELFKSFDVKRTGEPLATQLVPDEII